MNLKPCLFCGNPHPDLVCITEASFIECGKCQCRGAVYSLRITAVAAWNRRAPDPDAFRAELAALREEREQVRTAMQCLHPEHAGGMSDAEFARLWNATLALLDRETPLPETDR